MIGLVMALVLVLVPTPYERLGACGKAIVRHHNAVRVEHGLRPLRVDWSMHKVALRHSREMREDQVLRHSDPPMYSENVGYSVDRLTLNAAWVGSEGHLDNILGPYRWIGPGCAHESGRTWGTVEFR